MSTRVLIVEDDKDIRETVRSLLSSEGYVVEVAGNGQEALMYLRQTAQLPCVILLDLSMPIMDGFQFREVQSKDSALAHIPVVIMTADGHTDEKKVRTQARLALKKPADIDEILDAVKQCCARP